MLISSMTDEQLTSNANQIKDIVIFQLEKEGLLNKPAKEICETYAVILHRRGFFGKIIDKMMGIEGDRLIISMVKMLEPPQ